jgi:hypothetical protein
MYDNDPTMPATVADFLTLARDTMTSTAGDAPTEREVWIANAYTSAARILTRDPAALADLRCAHLRLLDAADDDTTDWSGQLSAAETWLGIASAAATHRAQADAEQAAALPPVVTLPDLGG